MFHDLCKFFLNAMAEAVFQSCIYVFLFSMDHLRLLVGAADGDGHGCLIRKQFLVLGMHECIRRVFDTITSSNWSLFLLLFYFYDDVLASASRCVAVCRLRVLTK